MHLKDVLRYGHATVLKSVDGLPDSDWQTTGVCGVWSVKDIIAHLASYEYLLIDVLNSLMGTTSTPYLQQLFTQGPSFNDVEVAARKSKSSEEAMQEYVETYERGLTLLDKLPENLMNKTGALAWYGEEYDLEDFVVYTFYGHKREHTGQIGLFRG